MNNLTEKFTPDEIKYELRKDSTIIKLWTDGLYENLTPIERYRLAELEENGTLKQKIQEQTKK